MEHKSNKSSKKKKKWEGGKQILKNRRFKRFEKRQYRINKIQHNCNRNIQIENQINRKNKC